MKTKEIIKGEYELYETEFEELESNCDDVVGYLKSYIGELEEDKVDVIKAIKQNSRDASLAKIKNRLLFFFEEEDINGYINDNKLLDEELDLVLIYEYILNKMLGVVNEENSGEIFKLFNFTVLSYNDNFNHIESKRDELYYQSKGIFFQDKESENTVNEFLEFFKEEISRISLIKPVAKEKK